MSDVESRLAALEAAVTRHTAEIARLSGHRPTSASISVTEEADIAAVRAGMQAQGWDRFPTDSDVARALRAGVSVAVLLDHFGKIKARGWKEGAHVVNIVRIHKSLYPYLLDGTGIGYAAAIASDEESKRLFGFDYSDLAAASSLPENAHKYIYDYLAFRDSGGEDGWTEREFKNGYYQ